MQEAALYPEIWIEAKTVDVTEVGTEVFYFTRISPQLMVLKEFATERHERSIVKVVSDEREVVRGPTIARYDIDRSGTVDIGSWGTCAIHLQSLPGAGTIPNQRVRIAYLLTVPTTFEKWLYDKELTEEELSAIKTVIAGITRKVAHEHSRIREITQDLTKLANDNPVVAAIPVPPGKKVTLLSVACEMAGLSPHRIFLQVRRDRTDLPLELDCFALPPLNSEQKCRINAVEELFVRVKNTVNIANFRVRVRYAVEPLTLLDKLRWKQELTNGERGIVEELNLEDVAKHGF